MALCPEGEGPTVRDHFKLLVSDSSYSADAGYRNKALRVGILQERRTAFQTP